MKILVEHEVLPSPRNTEECSSLCPWLREVGMWHVCLLFGDINEFIRRKECIKAVKDLEDYEELKWRMKQLEK